MVAISVSVLVWFESLTRYQYRYQFDINSGREYQNRFAVYLYDYIGIGIGIGMTISVEPYVPVRGGKKKVEEHKLRRFLQAENNEKSMH